MRRALVLLAAGLFAACAHRLLTTFDHRAVLADRECGGAGQPACQTCTSCHAKPATKKLTFDHDAHLAMPEVKGQCVKCHAGAVGFEGGAPLFPTMTSCRGCHVHDAQFTGGTCTNCHRIADLRGLRPLSFLPHDTAWMRRHPEAARNEPAQCATCHAQTQCDACHDSTRPLRAALANPTKVERDFQHRHDFLSRHALESRQSPGQCFTCHARQECNACHASRGVSPSVRGAQNPHPPGWASGLISNDHGVAARRDIASCAACHDQGAASNCVKCHKVGGIGGTPHLRGFRSSEPISSPSCAPCHGGGP